jgi:hypothetical protein
MRILPILLVVTTAFPAELRFRAEEIQRNFGIGYAVSIADVNGDGRSDIVAINQTQAVWFENGAGWRKHVMIDGATKKDNVCIAPYDIDGDGSVDFAIGADWQPTNTTTGGSLQWIRRTGGTWKVTSLGDEPTLHRIRWADVDGDGRSELVVAPLHGRENKAPEWQGNGARILVYRIPKDPVQDAWRPEVADDSLHIVHNITVVDLDRDGREEILTASREGVHLLKRSKEGAWTKQKIGEGSPGEIKAGRVERKRWLATVEPWHSSSLVLFEEAAPGLWKRKVIEDKLTGGHAIGWADFDGDGNEELAAGWRDKKGGVAVYRRGADGAWSKHMVDDGGMATEDLTTADLNNDGRPDIVAVGRATGNVKIYWNESEQPWRRHVISEGFPTMTAIAADFTGDGLPDIIADDYQAKRTILYAAPYWKPRVIANGIQAIHSEVMDVDGDGDPDYIGARYSPGYIVWLERPADPLKDEWKLHLVDDVVNGVHGLMKGDVDRDGIPDLIGNSAQPNGKFPESLAWFKIPTNPRVAPRWERHIFANRDAPGLSHYLGYGDVNGDGRPDLASAAKIPEGGNWFAWWEAPANPTRTGWKKHVIAQNQEGATNILMLDVNRDGKMDFIASRGHGKGLVWYEAPNWTPHDINADLRGPHSLAIGDIDGDGDIDAATATIDDFIAAWFENDGKGSFRTHPIYRDQAAYDTRLVDMDNDGDLDVLIAGQESRNVVWYENAMKR